jgi:hypothetical protein
MLEGRSRRLSHQLGGTGPDVQRAATLDDERRLKSGDVTTDYSVAELANLSEAANKVVRSRESPALTVLRIAA